MVEGKKLWSLLIIAVAFLIATPANSQRVTSGLISLYNFSEGSGSVVYDVSGQSPALNLNIQHPANVSWLNGGGLRINSSTIIRTPSAATRLYSTLYNSGEVSFEAWIKPTSASQTGLARIMTMSNGINSRNFTVGQSNGSYNCRLRTTASDNNGMPEVGQGCVMPNLQHLVYTWKNGVEKIYINAQLVYTGNRSGNLANWSSSFGFALCNEFSLDQGWLGEFYLAATYCQELDQNEVNQNFNFGSGCNHGSPSLVQTCTITGFQSSTGRIFYLPPYGTDFKASSSGLTFERYDNGTARLFGNIERISNANDKFAVDMWFRGESNYTAWLASGGGVKEPQLGNPSTWTFYSFDPARLQKLTGAGNLSGVKLYAYDMPDNNFGLQIGNGANALNTNANGFSTWFNFCGTQSGSGDINGTTNCQSICNNLTSGGQIGSNQTGCVGFDPAPITNITLPTGGSGNIETMWLYANASTNWNLTQVVGANDVNSYDPGPLQQTTKFRRCTRRAGCTEWIGESNDVTITVSGVCCNSSATAQFYNLQSNSVWGAIQNGTTYSLSDLPASFNIQADVSGSTHQSVKFVLSGPTSSSVIENVVPYRTPGDGTPLNLAPGNYTLTVYVYTSDNASGTLCDTEVLHFTIAGCDNVTSGGHVGSDQNGCSGYNPAAFTSIQEAQGGSGTLQYMWLYKSATTSWNWVSISGANSSTYDAGPLTETTVFRRCARRAGCGSWVGESNDVTVNITANCDCVNIEQVCEIAPASDHVIWVSAMLANQIGCNAQTFISSTPGTFTKYTDGSLKLEGSVRLSTDASKVINYVTWYRSKRTYSQWIAIPCPGSPTGFRSVKLDAGTSVTFTNEWLNWEYYELDPTKTNIWTGANGLAGLNLTVTHMPADYRYGGQLGTKASLQSNGYGFSSWIFLNGTFGNTVISSNGDYNVSLNNCTPGIAFDATPTVSQPTCATACDGRIVINAVGGVGNYTYLWNDGFTGSSRANLCSGTYSITVRSGFCSKTISVTLSGPSDCCYVNPGQIGADQTGCAGYDPNTFISVVDAITGGSGSVEYMWMRKSASTGNVFVAIPGANSVTYNSGALNETTIFRRCARRAGCAEWIGESNDITVTITTNCNCVTVEQTCQITQANDHVIWVSGSLANALGVNGTNFVATTPGTMTKYSDGSLKLEGTVRHANDANKIINYVTWYRFKRTYNQWTSIPNANTPSGFREIKLDAGTTVTFNNEWLNWEFYELDPNKTNKWTGANGLSGLDLTVSHMPSDYRYGGQLGTKASLQSNGYGFSSWINLTGTYGNTSIADHGDYNLNLSNCSNGVAFNATFTSTQPTCGAPCSGSISISAVGGIGNYTYIWNDGATAATRNNLCAGTYRVTVYSGVCAKELTIVLSAPTNCCAGACVSDFAPPTFPNQTSVYTLVCGQTIPLIQPTANDNCSTSLQFTYNDSSTCDTISSCDFKTYTQGGWGARAFGNNPGVYLNARFASVFPNGLTIGCGSKTLRLTSAAAVQYFLPSGGTPAALSQSLVNPGRLYKNTLAGNLVALTLNLAFDAADPAFAPATGSLGNQTIITGTFAGWTINQVAALANNVLGGCVTTYTPSQINNILNLINNNFNSGCNNGLINCSGTDNSCVCTTTRVWTVTDNCGNSSTFTQYFNLTDTSVPVANMEPQDFTLTCVDAIPSIPNVQFNDDCGIIREEYYTEETDTLDNGVVVITRNWTATDGCNLVQVDQLISILPCDASIGNFVWIDADRDGTQDNNEVGVAGVTVSLYNCDGTFLNNTTTDTNGFYLFANLAPNQSYYVVFSNLPNQYIFTSADLGGNDATDSDADNTGRTVCEPLSPGENNLNYDAGIYLPTASLGNYVWFDDNRNGIQDENETGVSGVSASLYTCAGAFVATTTTDINGNYIFTNLEPNQAYYVLFSNLPAQYSFSAADRGTDDALDSDANTAGRTICEFLTPGENYLDFDAGINIPTASLGDYVWYDVDRDGAQDQNENGVEGVTVTLYTCAGILVNTTTTDVSGLYLFANLSPNESYYVVFSNLPADYVFSAADQTNDALDSDANPNGRTVCKTLSPGENYLDFDAGINLPTASLGDFVWYDSDRDGIQDANETGVAGVTVSLYTCDNTFVSSTTTNGSGFYLFSNLEPNQAYFVIFSNTPAQYVFSTIDQGGDDTKDSDADATGMTVCEILTPGENYRDFDAGINLPTASLGNFVWFDTDRDGVQDSNESGVSGITVTLYTCADIFVSSTTTDANGNYLFSNLEPNQSYYVVFSNLPAQYVFSSADQGGNDALDSDANSAGRTVCELLSPGENNLDYDAGINIPTASLGDRVWFDNNQNGTQDGGENGVQGVTVQLYSCAGALLNTTTTDANGFYLFSNLEPNQSYYVVFSNIPTNYIFTKTNFGGNEATDSDADNTGKTNCVNLGPGENYRDLDGGVTTCPYPQLQGTEPQDVQQSCEIALPSVPNVSFIDPIFGAINAQFSEQFVDSICGDKYIRTWTATNPCGNTTVIDQVISLFDNTAPTLHGVPADETVECNSTIAAANVTASDNCDTSLNVQLTTQTDTLDCGIDIRRTWSVVDDCGNPASATQIIRIRDTQDPFVTTAVAPQLALSCDQAIPTNAPEFDDACDESLSIEFVQTVSDSSACGYTIRRRWTATDDCSNSITVLQTIVIRDTTAPELVNVPANIQVACNHIPAAPTVLATDNCSAPSVTMSETQTTGCPYTITRTWTATDACGLTATGTQIITVVDQAGPYVTHAVAPVVNIECGAAMPTEEPTFADSCSTSVTVNYEEFETSGGCVGGMIRRWTAKDACQNTTVVEQAVHVNDTTDPYVVTSVPADVTILCNETAPSQAPVFSDICDASLDVTSIVDTTNITNCGYIIHKSWTAKDNCNNDLTVFQTIHVVDTIRPTLHGVPGNVQVECTSIPTPALVTATDNCSEAGVSLHETIGTGCPYTITRTWTATDECGNTQSASQTITVVDTQAPTVVNGVPATLTVSCSGNVPTIAPTFSDLCTTNIQVNYSADTLNINSCGYDIHRVWTAIDNCNNDRVVEQTIFVRDGQQPVFGELPQNVTVQCNQVPAAAEVSATDNCSVPTVTMTETSTVGCPYTITRTWRATDACGNFATHTQEITVVDTVNPTLVGVPANTTAECGQVPGVAVVTANDNCSIGLVPNFEQHIEYVDSCSYNVVRTWSVSDACGNPASASQIIFVTDTTNPELGMRPSDATVMCDAIPQAPAISATDNCDTNVRIEYTENIGTGCPYVITRTWTAIDDCGNTDTHVQHINVIDTIAPVLYNVPLNSTIECTSTIPSANVFAIDNCTTGLLVSVDTSEVILTCGKQLTRTWSATDACGNTVSATQLITITDTTDPYLTSTPAAIVQLSCEMPLPAQAPTFNDLCDDLLDVEVSIDTLFADACRKEIRRIWIATDNCGNSASFEQLIVLQDATQPELSEAPANTTVLCNSIPAAATLTATDNCSVPNVQMTETATSGCPYTITRTWTATDACGNQSIREQLITVIDTIAPVLVGVPSDTLVECSAIPTAPVVTAQDNCSENLHVELNEVIGNTQSCSYTIYRTWTVVDNCGNTAEATQVISVTDFTAPIFTGVDTVIVAECNTTASFATPIASDNCDTNVLVIPSQQVIPGSCANSYTEVYTWKAYDNCNNYSTRIITVHYQDTTDPELQGVPADVTVLCNNIPAVAAVTASDNCSPNIVPVFTETRTNGCPYTIRRKWSATDACGNDVERVQLIQVIDTIRPTLTGVPQNLSLECGDAIPNAQVTAFDNCAESIPVSAHETQQPIACGIQIVRTWTATDACNNTSTAQQTITITDTEAPIVVTHPAAELWLECNDIAPSATVTFSDVCDQSLTYGYTETVENQTNCGRDLVRTWSATDDCGFTSSFVQRIHFTDNTSPVLVGVPADLLNVECSAIPAPANVTATDNCSVPSVAYSESIVAFSACSFVITRTWTATDACGLTSSASQTIITHDTTPAAVISSPEDLTLECGQPVPFVAPIFHDNCDANLEITFAADTTNIECGISIYRSWTAVDECFNSITVNQYITISDTQNPVIDFVPGDITVECGQDYALENIHAYDACDSDLSVDYSMSTIPTSCGSHFVRRWVVSDDCGHTVEATQNIYIVDETEPTVHNVPANLSIECGQPVPAPSSNVTATDNCSGNIAIQVEEETIPLACGYQIKRSYIAVDACGNEGVGYQWITVSDNTPPTMPQAPANVTVECGNIPTAATLVASDVCDSNVPVIVTEEVGSGCPYTITRRWTATDDCGNATVRTQVITVIDNTDPVFDNTATEEWINCDSIASYMPSASDNCDSDVSVTLISETLYSGGCYGTLLRTYEAEDNCGNTTQLFKVIHVRDFVDPVLFNVPAETSIVCGAQVPAVPTNVFATDNCDNEVEVIFTESQTNQFCPYDIVRTWTAIDECENTVTATQIIHVTVEVPNNVRLAVYPNPANEGRFTFEFSVPTDQPVYGSIRDVAGREAIVLMSGTADGGRLYKMVYDSDRLEAGTYIVHMVVNGQNYQQKLIIAGNK
jgi:hypothetical protein